MRDILIDRSRRMVCVPYSIEALHETAEHLGLEPIWYMPGRYPYYRVPRYRYAELTHIYGVVAPKGVMKIIRQFRLDEEHKSKKEKDRARQ